MSVEQYAESQLQRLLAEDGRVAELGIRVTRLQEGGLALSGEVESPQRRDEIERLVRAALPDVEVCCDIGIIRAAAPTEHEELS